MSNGELCHINRAVRQRLNDKLNKMTRDVEGRKGQRGTRKKPREKEEAMREGKRYKEREGMSHGAIGHVNRAIEHSITK